MLVLRVFFILDCTFDCLVRNLGDIGQRPLSYFLSSLFPSSVLEKSKCKSWFTIHLNLSSLRNLRKWAHFTVTRLFVWTMKQRHWRRRQRWKSFWAASRLPSVRLPPSCVGSSPTALVWTRCFFRKLLSATR